MSWELMNSKGKSACEVKFYAYSVFFVKVCIETPF